MTQTEVINNLLEFIENSNVDPDSELYFNAIESLKYLCECKLIHYKDGD